MSVKFEVNGEGSEASYLDLLKRLGENFTNTQVLFHYFGRTPSLPCSAPSGIRVLSTGMQRWGVIQVLGSGL